MPRPLKDYYSPIFKSQQQKYYSSLPEKQARHFLGMEYIRLGPGSQRYLSRVFGCSRSRIQTGIKELKACNFQPQYARQRVAGGGRKKKKSPSLS